MATLREVRQRISGVKKTQKITRAMKMVAASKLRRAQAGVVATRPYARTIRSLLMHVSGTMEGQTNELMMPRHVASVALVVVTADRGLCGAFNANLIRAAVNHLEVNHGDLLSTKSYRIFAIGKKGADFFAKRNYVIGAKYLGLFHALSFVQARRIVRDLVEAYRRGEFDRVDVIYNEFKSVSQQRIVVEQFLPIPAEADVQAGSRHVAWDYIYEPGRAAILSAIVPKHLNVQMWRILLESNAAEQGARMAAMENATENANELIDTLQLQYNKARQAAITKELLEVVTGAEALTRAE